MKLSQMIRDEIDGAIECRGRDSQLTEWARKAEELEDALQALYDSASPKVPGGWQKIPSDDSMAQARAALAAVKEAAALKAWEAAREAHLARLPKVLL